MSQTDADRNLLFGVLALQVELIDERQFVNACAGWAAHRDTSLSHLLLERGWISVDDRQQVERLLGRKLKKHGGDVRTTLGSVADAAARDAIRSIDDSEIRKSLSSLPPVAGYVLTATILPNEVRNRTRYTLSRLHAEGGLGKVWVAHDRDLNREVALKEIQADKASHPDMWRRFLKEAQVTGQLEHPNIVPVYELAARTEDGQPFYTMRLVRGQTLREAIAEYHSHRANASADPVERLRLLQAFVSVCQAIAYAHSRRVVHRDLKPENVVLGGFGEVIVLDWGLARVLNETDEDDDSSGIAVTDDARTDPTRAGRQIGSPHYMAPEQAEGRLDLIDTRTDVYGLGTILFELLTGRPPHAGTNVFDMMRQIVTGSTPRAKVIEPSAPVALDAIAARAMAKDRNDRYATASELSEEVQHWMADEPVKAFREGLSRRAARWARRHRAWAQSGVAALLLVAMVASVAAVAINVARRKTAAALKAEQAISMFYENNVLAAARPKGWDGGGGKDVTLKETLDNAVSKISDAFVGEPDLEAEVRNTLGMTYWYLGKFDAANPLLEKAYAIRLAELGPDHPDTLTSLHDLAMERWKQDRLTEAIELARNALERRRRMLGAEHRDTLWTQLNLGLFLSEAGRLDEAETTLRQAIERCQRALGHEHHHTLYGQNDLALILSAEGMQQEALAMDRHTLEGRRHSLGPDHPDTLRSMGNLAYDLDLVGELEKAEAICRQTLEARRRVLGDEHEETLLAENNLGTVLCEEGDYPESEKWLSRCLETSRRVLGREHSRTLLTQSNLARLLGEKGKVAEANALCRQTLERQRRLLGPDSPYTLRSQSKLAKMLEEQGEFIEAESLCRQTLEKQRRIIGADNYYTMITQDHLASVLAQQGKLSEAEALCRQSLESRVRRLGRENYYTLRSLNSLAEILVEQGTSIEAETLFREVLAIERKNSRTENLDLAVTLTDLGSLLVDRGRPAAAEPLLREGLRIRETKLPANHWRISNTRSLLGSSLTGQGKFAEAEPLLLTGYAGLAKAEGAQSKRQGAAIQRVILLYEKWGKSKLADNWRKKQTAAP